MLPKENRLSKDNDFKKVFQKGRRSGSAKVNVNFLKTRLSVTRVGIIVGKKFSKKAVERNKAKRVYREAIRSIFADIVPGYDIVVFLKPGQKAEFVKLDQVKKDLVAVFNKEGLLH